MTYTRTQYATDKERGVFRVKDVCFDNSESDIEVKEVFSEISKMEVVPPALMTRKALGRYMEAPDYVLERMASMPIGSSFNYGCTRITRCSRLTYNGRRIV